jgi:hypothetical protein
MGALSKFVFGGGGKVKNEHGNWVAAEPATLEVGMTEANFSNKNLGAGDAIIISAWLTHKDNGALSKFTFSGDESGWNVDSKNSKPVTVALGMTKADFSGKVLGVSGAIILAAWITQKDNGAISTVTVNTFPLPIQEIKSKTELDFSNKGLQVEDVIVIAALLPLNVSRTISTFFCYR